MGKIDLDFMRNRPQGILGQEYSFQSAVFLPLVEFGGETCVLFEKRAADMKMQPGEICFPGGGIDATDQSPAYAAIRETSEELGVKESDIQLIAPLDIFVSPFGAIIYPYAGYIHNPEQIKLNPDEVEETFNVPLDFLLNQQPIEHKLSFKLDFPENYPFELVPGGRDYPYRRAFMPQQFYIWEDRIIWGLTARILHHFLGLIKKQHS